jgi:hypothetical protein
MIRIDGECERVTNRGDRMRHPMPGATDRAILHRRDRPERGAVLAWTWRFDR